jgi:hypothetical protein
MLSIESRLRRLEQQSGARRLIVLQMYENEDANAILAASGITAADDDLVVSLVRFEVGRGDLPALDKRIISIGGMTS